MSKELKEGDFFSKRAASEMLDQTVLEAMVPDLPVLRMAYLIELDFAKFYENSARKAKGEVKKSCSYWQNGNERMRCYLGTCMIRHTRPMPGCLVEAEPVR
ncbi:MAG: hypothetical protein HY781_01050 [Chloroflexi bacterium]|nr:hypothetical protein [Chloroflexota bacterium]